MRLPKRGEKGFTLIELLIVVAILGVLAAVVIPNVGRFIGAGEEEAAETEFANIQTAVVAMMVDNALSSLPNPVDTSTADMSKFPSPNSTDSNYNYVLYGFTDNVTGATVNYVATGNATRSYTVASDGTITQH